MRKLLGLAGASVCVLAFAAQPWPQEPEKVVGIRLGAPLAESGYQECSGVPSNEPCLARQTGGMSQLHRTGLRATITVLEFEGVVGAITMTLPRGEFEEFTQTLIERYGNPHHDTPSQVQNRVGAVFSNRQLRWEGARIRIMMSERHSDLDTSVAQFFDKATSARLVNKNRERAKSDASKL